MVLRLSSVSTKAENKTEKCLHDSFQNIYKARQKKNILCGISPFGFVHIRQYWIKRIKILSS